MIEFFRDVLSGPLYIVTSILSIIFIMAIIGFMMERKKLEKEQNEQIAHINRQSITQNDIPPVLPQEPIIESVTPIQNDEIIEPVLNIEVPNTDISDENNIEQPVDDIQPVNNKQFIIFTDPDQKEE